MILFLIVYLILQYPPQKQQIAIPFNLILSPNLSWVDLSQNTMHLHSILSESSSNTLNSFQLSTSCTSNSSFQVTYLFFLILLLLLLLLLLCPATYPMELFLIFVYVVVPPETLTTVLTPFESLILVAAVLITYFTKYTLVLFFLEKLIDMCVVFGSCPKKKNKSQKIILLFRKESFQETEIERERDLICFLLPLLFLFENSLNFLFLFFLYASPLPQIM